MRLHTYAGKEQGAMLIGTSEDLKGLATDLLTALNAQPQRSDQEWPPELLHRDISETQNGKSSDFVLSIHLETESAAKPSPNLRSKIAFPLLVVTVAIALWQVISWVRSLAA